MVGRTPFAGVAWQALHYLEAFRRLGCDVYYVEDTGDWPYDRDQDTVTDDCAYTTGFIARLMKWCGFEDRWAYRGPELPEPPLTADLRALGFPAELASRAHGEDPYQAVLTALTDLAAPPALPARPGDIFTVLGELAPALRIADWAAKTLRLDAAEILLAGPTTFGTPIQPSHRITGPADAERRARKIERADTPYVVVVDAPIGVDPAWAREILGAISPTATWATVDATRKAGDTANHLRALGHLDAFAVFHAEVCADPGTVLALPAPVALLDGATATAHEWAALLSRRLSERRAAPAGTNREAPWR